MAQPPASPAPSYASKDSFLTATTSPSENQDSSSASPQPLRKSVSIDSFQYANTSATTRASRGIASSPIEPSRKAVLDLKRSRDQLGRSRGASISSVLSQTDRHSTGLVADRQHTALVGLTPNYQPSDLALPSRTPTLSSSSSLNSLTPSTSTKASNSTQEGMHRVQSASSLQVGSRPLPVLSPAGRARSGSLGVYAPSNGRRIQVSTNVNVWGLKHSEVSNTITKLHAIQPYFPSGTQPITLIVIGVPSCGKSVAIRKGMKAYHLSDAAHPVPGSSPVIQYSTRFGKIGDTMSTLNVIEVDILPTANNLSDAPLSFPPEYPIIHGVMICYDASSAPSFEPVRDLLVKYHRNRLPTVVLACKSDLERQVDPQYAAEVIQLYDAGLIEVTRESDSGKKKMRRSFDWLLTAILRERRTDRSEDHDYRNPASPDAITPAQELPRNDTPTVPAHNTTNGTSRRLSLVPTPTMSVSRAPATPTSPSRARSTGDLLSEHERWRSHVEWQPGAETPDRIPNSKEALHDNQTVEQGDSPQAKKPGESEARPAQWATIDELLDKLVFLAISGDDPTFITHFLLTYRRFATPRTVLLAMQKRMRQLDNPSGDPMFACFAQMRICHLLEIWIRDYPHDFAVRGTADALSALIRSIISRTYLLHYGSDFLPFLEVLPGLVDKDAAWALKMEDLADESDDSYSIDDDSFHEHRVSPDNSSAHRIEHTETIPAASPQSSSMSPSSRERKPSLPATSRTSFPFHAEPTESGSKHHLKELVQSAHTLNAVDSEEIAREITRIQVNLFLDIEPRHWMHYALVSGKKDPERDPVTRFNDLSNQIANWVVSLILCHDRARLRAKQIEKFVEIAQKLRGLNNYAALQAFVAGINGSTFQGDETFDLFTQRFPDHAKTLKSWEVLLRPIKSHHAYRMALKNTKGPCIPALGVHVLDLIKSHEGNPDYHQSDTSKIHWGKFNIMGRLISSTAQYQAQCRSSNDYKISKNAQVWDLIMNVPLLSEEAQAARSSPPGADGEDYKAISPPLPRENTSRDAPILRRIFFR